MVATFDDIPIGKGIVYFRKFTKTPVAWAASTAYALGDYVYQPTTDGLYVVTTAGTSAAGPATGPSGSGTGITDGTVTWKSVDWIDLGNVPSMKWKPEFESKELYSARSGIKIRAKKVPILAKGSVTIVMQAATFENLELAFLGELSGSAPNRKIEIFKNPIVYGQVKFEARNDIGPRRDAFFGNCAFEASGEVDFISDDWAEYEVTAEVGQDGLGNYGWITEAA